MASQWVAMHTGDPPQCTRLAPSFASPRSRCSGKSNWSVNGAHIVHLPTVLAVPVLAVWIVSALDAENSPLADTV